MTDKARELLERALKGLENRKDEVADWGAYASEYFQNKWGYEDSIVEFDGLMEEIRAYLAEPEVKREPLHLNDVVKAFNDSEACGIMDNFIAGVLFAEKHHGIGGGDE